MSLFEKTHKRYDKCNRESVGSWYLQLEIGSIPKDKASETFENYNSIQESTGSWNLWKIIPSYSELIAIYWAERLTAAQEFLSSIFLLFIGVLLQP